MEYCSQCKKLQAQGLKVCPDDGAEIVITKDLPAGVMLGVYRFEKKLGQGGMGAVYEAEHTVLQKRCAIKILLPKFAAQPEVCARFLQEARATNAIKHDHIIQIYDFGRSPDGGAFLVMEFLEGSPLDKRIKEQGKLPHEALVEIFYQLSDALHVAHQSNVIHRDLKPENVFLLDNTNQKYFSKVLDFGVAKIQGDLAVPGLTRAGTVVGTPQYISPEQLTGKPVSGTADIYSLGVIFYQCATGELPFKGPRLSDFAQQHIFETPKSPKQLAPELHEGLSSLILRMLAKKPEERPASMQEVAQALSALRVGRSDPLLITPPPMTIEKLPSAGGSAWWVLAAAAAILALVIGYVLLAPPPAPRDARAEAFAAAQKGEFGAISPYAEEQVAKAFTAEDVNRRREAISAVQATGYVKKLSWLTTALQDPDTEVKKLAALAIVELNKTEAKEALFQAYQEAGKRLQPQLLFALVELSPEAQLIDLTSKELENPVLRFDAAFALAQAKNSTGIEALRQELEDGNTNKERAVKAADFFLRTEKSEAAKNILLRALTDPEPLSYMAAKALSENDIPEGRAALTQASKDNFTALVYRAHLSDKNARPALLQALDGAHQREAILALARFHNKEDLARLIPLLQSDNVSLQDAAAQAILTILATGENP
jgi:HEAT repeat protein/tRNA A-37 threonylcarbamoyl transferase component Bud32